MGNIISTFLNNDISLNSECFDICKLSVDIDHNEGQHHNIKIGDVIEYND
jgi:hypothetical protein